MQWWWKIGTEGSSVMTLMAALVMFAVMAIRIMILSFHLCIPVCEGVSLMSWLERVNVIRAMMTVTGHNWWYTVNRGGLASVCNNDDAQVGRTHLSLFIRWTKVTWPVFCTSSTFVYINRFISFCLWYAALFNIVSHTTYIIRRYSPKTTRAESGRFMPAQISRGPGVRWKF